MPEFAPQDSSVGEAVATPSPSTLQIPLRIADIVDRTKVKGTYLAARKLQSQDKNGKVIVSLLLSDRSGQVEARIFENAERLGQGFSDGDLIKVTGLAKSYLGRLQVHLFNVERVDKAGVSLADFVPSSKKDADSMWHELLLAIGTIKDQDIALLLRTLFTDPEVADAFRKSPAARSIHHAYVGGLLQHNLSVYRIIDALCAHYEEEAPGLLDRDLCVAGGLLHDFGKIYELSVSHTIEYTHEGQLLGHLVQCSQKLAEVAATLPNFPRHRLVELQHIVLAHHDRLEFGSPKRPHTAEAMLVHAADMLDSRMGFLQQLFTREPSSGWTSYQRMFDRPFYRSQGKGPTPSGISSEPLYEGD